MRIAIAERLRSHSHRPGSYCLLPGSTLRLEIFPALLRVDDLSDVDPRPVAEFSWDIRGPVRDFTIVQDLEKGNVRVWGHTQTGFMRYACYGMGARSFGIHVEKAPPEGLHATNVDTIPLIEKGQGFQAPKSERLSLGSHKKQEWDLMARRLSMAEIFPHWLRLAHLTPPTPTAPRVGTLALLTGEARPEKIVPIFDNIFLAGFEGMLSPRLTDRLHLGLHLPPIPPDYAGTPLQLLHEGAAWIRSLFIEQEGNILHLLPCLPPEFHCGRLVGDAIDLEWSKKSIRRAILRSQTEGEVHLRLQSHIKSFRLRQTKNDKGKRVKSDEPLSLLPNTEYYLDNFQH